MKRRRFVNIVRGFGGWWIYRLEVHLLREQRYIGPYKFSAVAGAMARRRGYTVRVTEGED